MFFANVKCQSDAKYFGGFISFADWLPVDLGKQHTIEPQEE